MPLWPHLGVLHVLHAPLVPPRCTSCTSFPCGPNGWPSAAHSALPFALCAPCTDVTRSSKSDPPFTTHSPSPAYCALPLCLWLPPLHPVLTAPFPSIRPAAPSPSPSTHPPLPTPLHRCRAACPRSPSTHILLPFALHSQPPPLYPLLAAPSLPFALQPSLLQPLLTPPSPSMSTHSPLPFALYAPLAPAQMSRGLPVLPFAHKPLSP